jgi:hypothetical protein
VLEGRCERRCWGDQEVLFPKRIRAEVVVCEGSAGPDLGVRSVREVVWVFELAIVVFGSLAKGVVAAGYRLLEPFPVGLSDRHVVVVGAVVSVVSAAHRVLGLAEASASYTISLARLFCRSAISSVLAYVEVGCYVAWFPVRASVLYWWDL